MDSPSISSMGAANRRPGFLLRLGTLIVLQVLFIFAALALIIFGPSNDSTPFNYQNRRHQVAAITESLKPVLRDLPEERRTTDSHFLESLRAANPQIVAAAIYQRQGDGTIKQIWNLDLAFDQQDGDEHDAFSYVNLNMIELALCQPEDFIITQPAATANPVTYYHMQLADSSDAVLMAVENGDSIIASRASLKYTMFVLFLCATLISLLTVYLLYRRFKEPLDRLSRGLDKTADGEVFYLMETEGDEELQGLCRSVNRMTETLWQNQGKLRQFNTRLNDMNAKLIESQLFMTTLIDSSPFAIIVTSVDGQIVLFNRGASEAFGCTYDAIVGVSIDRLFQVGQEKGKSQEGSPIVDGFETICRRADNEFFPAYVLASPVLARDGRVSAILYILRDISESQNFQNMMVRLDRFATRGQMAGDIAHEINNYLAILLGNLELLPLIIKKGDLEKTEKKLEVMKGTVDKIGRFAAGLLDLPQDEACFEPANLNQLVENVLAFVRPQNKFDLIEFDTVLSSDLPLAQVDAGQIQQLLVNLVYNAASAMENVEGEKRIKISTFAGSLNGTPSVRVDVHDSGPGVPVEKEGNLFVTRFTTKKKGHGIGLVTCRKIVDAHHGRISYRKDGGAVFSFELPVTSPVPAVAQTTDEAAPAQPAIA